MIVFVAWSGDRSKRVALRLKTWLPDMLGQVVRPWVSPNDIHAGAGWSDSLDAALRDADFGVICLTPENLQREWILFETGMLFGRLPKDRVVPYQIGVKHTELHGPLGRVQGVEATRPGTLHLLGSINRALEEGLQSSDTDLARKMDKNFWEELEEAVSSAHRSKDPAPPRKPGAATEEILSIVQGIAFRLDELVEVGDRKNVGRPGQRPYKARPLRILGAGEE